MTYQTVLLILLAIMSLVLAVLLVTRIRSEKKRMAVIPRMGLAEFSDFLKTNSTDGSIQVIARRVSDFLKDTFGCEHIIFLRKQRSWLELNYYHGIRGFRRDEFRFRFTRTLADNMKVNPLPRSIDLLMREIPEPVMGRLKHHKFDLFFPIYWRDNLYGLYLIKSSLATGTEAFNLLITSLAHSLAAAYHIKWHEARYDKLEQKTLEADRSPRGGSSSGILRLVKHRQSESLMPQIAKTIQQEQALSRVAVLYESTAKDEPIIVWQNGASAPIESPDHQKFERLLSGISLADPSAIGDLSSSEEFSSSLTDRLREAGLDYVARLSVTPKRKGLLAWSAPNENRLVGSQLAQYQRNTFDLFENAEAYERVEAMSNTDSLTGLANQRYFYKRLHEEINRAIRYQRSLALIIFDLDDLKGTNDRYGHLAGNAVLKRLGQILKSSIRAIDVIARYGGDEFCVIMPEAGQPTCERFMQRLQQKISSSRFYVSENGAAVPCTISQGGAIFPASGPNAESLMKAADSALLRAKGLGRDQYVIAVELPTTPAN